MNSIIIASVFSGTVWQILKGTSAFGIFIFSVLIIMSVVSWMIIFYKWREFRAADTDTASFQQHFKRTRQLAEAAGQAKSYGQSPLSALFRAGFDELTALKEHKNEGGALQSTVRPLDDDDLELIEMSMEKTLTEEIARFEKKVVFLATTGSSAPFMGLLGTVVGIMNAFWSIGARGNASLAIVAPGIAEALLATIVGLGAAIPAVIAYNWANNKLKILNDRSSGFILDFVSRAKKENR